MYRKLLGGTAIALALAASPAFAADLSYPVKAPPMMAPIPVFTWTGFYIGANVGYGWGDVSGYDPYLPDNYITSGLVTSGSGDPDGWFGGFQAGYNYQFYNNVVLGVEADVEFADMKDTYRFGYTVTDDLNQQGENDFGVFGKYTTKIDAFGTIRARLGYSIDRLLPYVTGGLAWANVKVSGETVIADDTEVAGWSGSFSDTYWGWAIGGGAEYALTDNWTMKAEYIYSDLGSTNFSGLFNKNDLDFSMQTLKVGVNYKF